MIKSWDRTDFSNSKSIYITFQFFADETFYYSETGGNVPVVMSGMYTISNGKIHITGFHHVKNDGGKEEREDKVVEYTIGEDELGEYLTIGNIVVVRSYAEDTYPNMKYRPMNRN